MDASNVAGVVGSLRVDAYHIWTAHRLVASNNPFEYLVTLIFAVLGVIVIGYWKGESPRWQWGLKNKKTAQGSSEKRLEKKS